MRRRTMVFLPAALALVVLAAACGRSAGGRDSADGVASAGNKSRTKSASDGKPSSDPQQAGLDFARCMREHGVDMPDPTGEGGMVMIGPGPGAGQGGSSFSGPPAGFEEADEACRHFLDGLIDVGSGPMDPVEQDRALKFAQCMREHGVDMPDPKFDGGRVQIAIGGDGAQVDRATVDDAHTVCAPLFGPARGGTTGPAPGRGEVARA